MSSPTSTHNELQSAVRLLSEERADEAREILERLVEVAPSYAVAYVLLARACEMDGHPEAALDAWKRAAQLVPASPLIQRERKRVAHLRKGERAISPGPSEHTGSTPARGWEIMGEVEDAPSADTTVEVETVPPENDDEKEREPLRELDTSPGARPSEKEPKTEPTDALTGELDDLIERLENATRITPNPDFDGPEVELATEAPPDMASETLAGVYAAQGQYEKAAETYARLAEQTPERAEDFRKRAAEMRERM